MLQPPTGGAYSVKDEPLTKEVYEPGTYTLIASDGNITESTSTAVFLTTATTSASLEVDDGPVPRVVALTDSSIIFGHRLSLVATTNGDGAPSYAVVSGPGVLSGESLTASSVGTIRVRVDYPATATYTAGSAEADVTVIPRPVTFTLADQDFDFDGVSKTATFSVDQPQAIVEGMVDTSGLTVAPEVNTYAVSVSASGNYVGSASARVRVFPVLNSFVAAEPPAPHVVEAFAPPMVQWPVSPSLRWTTRDAAAVRVTDDSGVQISSSPSQELALPRLDVRETPYRYTVSAQPHPAALSFSQRGGSWARLRGPSGLEVDVTSETTFFATESGVYTYEFGANGLSRTATVTVAVPPVATRVASVAITPATVSAEWADRDADGPMLLSASDFPKWKIQTGDDAPGSSTMLLWNRSDDNAAGGLALEEKLLPGTYVLTATFSPPNQNYSFATVRSTWRLTAPLTVSGDNAQVAFNDVLIPAARVLRILPGTTAMFSAEPNPNFDFGEDWDQSSPQIWSSSKEVVLDAGARTIRVKVPAGIESLWLTASAFQIGPRVIRFSPVASSHTVLSGPAEGRTYARSWQSGSGWNAYLGRDGVTFTVVGQSRESRIVGYEIEARPPNGQWFTLASGAPPDQVENGPRAEVAQTFSARLGNVIPEKPLIPSNLQLAGSWDLRARVRSSVGTLSAWSSVQTLNVLVPLQTVTLQGRTLPPVNEAAWFAASPSKAYSFQVWIP